MNQTEKAKRFAKLHVKGSPLVLYNAWDAGSATSIVEAGAKAIATSSWSVAAAQGYDDGEEIPIELVEKIIERIVEKVKAPVTVDFEGGYSEDDHELTKNISRLLDLGVSASTSKTALSKAQVYTRSIGRPSVSPSSVKQQTERESRFSSMPARTFSLRAAATSQSPSMQLLIGRRPMPMRERQAFSSPDCSRRP